MKPITVENLTVRLDSETGLVRVDCLRCGHYWTHPESSKATQMVTVQLITIAQAHPPRGTCWKAG